MRERFLCENVVSRSSSNSSLLRLPPWGPSALPEAASGIELKNLGIIFEWESSCFQPVNWIDRFVDL